MTAGCSKCEQGGTGPHPIYCTKEMRFWAKVRKTDGCWLWTGAVTSNDGGVALTTFAEIGSA